MRWFVWIGFALGFSPIGLAAPIQATDITTRVIRESDLDEQVAQACQDYCQGNQRAGRLTRVLVKRSRGHLFAVRADARLVNREYQEFGVGEGIELYRYEINVEAYGTLDERTCELRVDRIDLINDQLGLGKLIEDQEGQIYPIENCRRFVAGL
jgi:hypothetical protein